jgi:hypothetical protein|tara:strand:+ start:1161 stop:1559 length:399 start_codon:yes stop_codon:yes gene_type:complete
MTDLTNVFDLETGADKGAFLHLEHPVTGEKLYTEDGKAIGIDAVGVDSAQYRRKVSQMANRKMGKRQKNPTLEKAEQEGAELLAACVVRCHNLKFGDDEMTPKNAEQFLLKYRSIREQLDEFVGDRRNFFNA